MPSTRRRVSDHARALHAMAQKRFYERNKENPEFLVARSKYQVRYRGQNPAKKSAHNAVYRAVKRGDLVRPESCSECGVTERRIEASHFDYSHPLLVEWLCRQCHARKDRRY